MQISTDILGLGLGLGLGHPKISFEMNLPYYSENCWSGFWVRDFRSYLLYELKKWLRLNLLYFLLIFWVWVLPFVRPREVVKLNPQLKFLGLTFCVTQHQHSGINVPTFCATSKSGRTRPPSCRLARFSSDCRSSWWSPFDRRSGPPCRPRQCRRKTRSTWKSD